MSRVSNRTLALVALLAFSLAAIVLSRIGVLRPLQSIAIIPLQPLQRVVTDVGENIVRRSEQPEDVDVLQERVLELEQALAASQVDLVRLREIERDYDRLTGLLDFTFQNQDQQLVAANVIRRDTSGFLRFIIINAGVRDGVRVGQPVINDRGLVGQISDVTATAAWVRLANDQRSAINARLQNSRAEGTVVGQLTGGMRMQFIPQGAILEEGDLVLTSGLGGNVPSDIVIGQVASIRTQEAELFQEAEVRPTVDFDRLEIVAVIVDFDPIDPSIFDDFIDEQLEGEQ